MIVKKDSAGKIKAKVREHPSGELRATNKPEGKSGGEDSEGVAGQCEGEITNTSGL